MPLISLVIVNYNAKHLLKSCIDSINAQTYKQKEIIIIDNNSTDGSCQYSQEQFPDVTTVCQNKNLGYGMGANEGIKLAKGEYVMILNADIKFEENYIEKCLAKMESDPEIGVIGGKLYKYNFKNDHKTNFIDTVGLFSYRNRRIIDDGQGLPDKGQFDEEKEIFGVSGACPIYRKSALEDIKVFGEYFDDQFFMYKEDIDVSWRLRLRGWKCWYLPTAVAHHGRGTGVLKRFSHIEVLKNRRKLNKFQKYYSFKNQRLMQFKNEFFRGFLADFFPIIWREMLIFGYAIFKEPFLLKAELQIISQLPRILKKRNYIMKNAKVNWKDMQKWLSGKQSKYLEYELEHPEDDVA